MKKSRLEEERNPAPTTRVNTMLIQDEPSCTLIESSADDDDDEDLHDNTDIYSFAVTTISSNAIKI